MRQNLLPVLLGGDMNCYSVARAFHEEYGVCSHAFGRYAMGETKYSRIVQVHIVPDMDEDEVLLRILAEFAAAHPNETRVLMGCTDDYAALIIRHREALSAQYVVPYIGGPLMRQLVSKQSFYNLCQQYDIPYPATVIFGKTSDPAELDALPFSYPIIVKPSSSIAYWKHPFEGMQKVYVAQNAAEAKEIAAAVFGSGYPDTLILQDMIPGADDGMRVLTAYSDRNAKVKMMCLGHVMLEEHTPKARGNHAAILTEYNEELMRKIQLFLEAVGYTGFANFDIKYDLRDGSYRVFEINLRTGRSGYYVTGAGLNVARYVVEDRVLEKDLGEPVLYSGESFWHSIPRRVVWDYTADEALVEKAKAIAKAGRDTTALGYRYDTCMNPLRWAFVQARSYSYHKKYATHCTKRVNVNK